VSPRLRDDRGAGRVAGIVLMFAVTFLGLIWLAGTVDRGISNQSAATSIAFQAARAGAQEARPVEIRGGDVENLDVARAQAAANGTAARLFTSYGLTGQATATVEVTGTTVIVTVIITASSKTVTGRGAAEAVEVP
jgi:Tfp pilus assembly protein PilX